MTLSIVIANFVTTLMLTGIVWFVQIVHYPLFTRVDESAFVKYERAHTQLTGYVIAPLMLVELVTAILLVLYPGRLVSPLQAWIGVSLVAVLWLSTFLVQVPLHRILLARFDVAAVRRLVTTNWLRTFFWSGRSALSVWILAELLTYRK